MAISSTGGLPEKYAFNLTNERLAADRQTIVNYANEIFRLVESHLMTHRDEARYILCQFRERGELVNVVSAAAGDQVAASADNI